jgi:hypothetical protein
MGSHSFRLFAFPQAKRRRIRRLTLAHRPAIKACVYAPRLQPTPTNPKIHPMKRTLIPIFIAAAFATACSTQQAEGVASAATS